MLELEFPLSMSLLIKCNLKQTFSSDFKLSSGINALGIFALTKKEKRHFNELHAV